MTKSNFQGIILSNIIKQKRVWFSSKNCKKYPLYFGTRFRPQIQPWLRWGYLYPPYLLLSKHNSSHSTLFYLCVILHLSFHTCFHSFVPYSSIPHTLLSIYYVLGTILDNGSTRVNKKQSMPLGTLLSSQVQSESESHSVIFNSFWPHGLYSPWNSTGQNTGVGSLSCLQGIFPTKRLNPGLPYCRQILYQLSHQGSPRILE